jgi:hypothetical protein
MPNGTLDGFNHVLDFDEGLTHVFRVSAIVFFRQSFRDVASVRNLSISCCDQPLNILVILSHSGGLLLINLFARQPWQLGDIGRDPLLFKYSFAHPFLLKGVDRILGAGDYRVVTDKNSSKNYHFPFIAAWPL